ncbi:hypothetical protein GCM10009647_090070 [Streptomyces sanglieri]
MRVSATDQDDPAARAEDPSCLCHRAPWLLKYVEDLVGKVAAHASVGERQILRPRLPELGLRPPLPGRGQHPRVGVHAHRVDAAFDQLSDGSSGAAANVHDGRARDERQQFVGAGPQPSGARHLVRSVEDGQQGFGVAVLFHRFLILGHGRHAAT